MKMFFEEGGKYILAVIVGLAGLWVIFNVNGIMSFLQTFMNGCLTSLFG